MTVRELMLALSALPLDLDVVIPGYEGGWNDLVAEQIWTQEVCDWGPESGGEVGAGLFGRYHTHGSDGPKDPAQPDRTVLVLGRGQN